jgi:hypothetical protein
VSPETIEEMIKAAVEFGNYQLKQTGLSRMITNRETLAGWV